MTLALLQPVFAPNLCDLAAMLRADRVVLQDLARWSRKGRVHRALIRTPEGSHYIRIPVSGEDRRKPIGQVRIDQSGDWVTPLLRSLRYNYRGSPFFDFYEAEVERDFRSGRQERFLLPFALRLRSRLLGYLGLEELTAKETLESDLEVYDPDPDRLARSLGAARLFQEHGARNYQRRAEMSTDPEFEHPEYRQHFGGFVPWCSLYDILFEIGPESYRLVDSLRAGTEG